MKMNFSPVRGTMEYLPKEAETREFVRRIILDTYSKNGFLLIKTPLLENLEFLTGGDSGDNSKLMFKTIKRGNKLDLSKQNLVEKDIVEEGLRYDQTIPMARFFCNNREKLTVPFKVCQIDDVFRAERPQHGRSRQFTQCDVDILGDSSINAEIEIILTVLEAYKNVGFEKVVMKINDRRILNQIIIKCGFLEKDCETICMTLDKIDKISVNGVKSELLEKSFKLELIEKLLDLIVNVKDKGLEYLSGVVEDGLISDMKSIIKTVNEFCPSNYSCIFEISIVRGQGYYTGAVYEAYTEGFAGAIGGGGRYDKMIEKLCGVAVPTVGFGLGFEPTLMLALEKNLQFDKTKRLALFFEKDTDFSKLLIKKQELKKQYNVTTFVMPKNFKNACEKLMTNGYYGYIVFEKDGIKLL